MHKVTAFVLALLMVGSAFAQMPRQRATTGGPVDEVFWAPTIIGMSSVTNLPKGNLNLTIRHSFGIATNGFEDLFGLDGAANIRFGIDYGITDRLSIGIGRTRYDKLYDFQFKANILRQTTDGKRPLELAVKGSAGVMTVENGFAFADRMNYLAGVMVARKFSEAFSLQIMPMFSHFNTVFIDQAGDGSIIEEENDHFAIGVGARYVLSDRYALLVEYLPVLGTRSDNTENTFSVGLDIETGGHVFQLFFTTTQWHTEQHIIARNTERFSDGDFRIGFNVNRVFH